MLGAAHAELWRQAVRGAALSGHAQSEFVTLRYV